MNEYPVEVFKVVVQPHPAADKLDCISACGYPTIVQKGRFKTGDLAAFVPPDSVVNTNRPEFAWLKKDGRDTHRVTACKLRGLPSFGIVLDVPEGVTEGDDLAEYFEVTHWNPSEKLQYHTDNVRPPRPPREKQVTCGSLFTPVYDLDNVRKYSDHFINGENVYVTEKLHGCNARFLFSSEDNEFYAGSRTLWKKENERCVWWKALKNDEALQKFLKQYPDVAVYGEVVGDVGGFPYGTAAGEVKFYAFDILKDGNWVPPLEARVLGHTLNWVPTFGMRQFDLTELEKLSEGKTTVPNADHVREGIVIEPLHGRVDEKLGRIKMKLVGLGYLMKNQD
jgi:RNA ligase (TIGR02306 family)